MKIKTSKFTEEERDVTFPIYKKSLAYIVKCVSEKCAIWIGDNSTLSLQIHDYINGSIFSEPYMDCDESEFDMAYMQMIEKINIKTYPKDEQ